MVLHCETYINMPPNRAFVGLRGNVISGVIRYTFGVPMPITHISASIEGVGTLKIEHLQKKDEEGNPETEIRRETYLDVNIHQDSEMYLRHGVFEVPFSVEIPHNIPPSLNYDKNGISYNVNCNINYCVQIIFHKLGSDSPFERFRREINIISGLVPRLPITSVTHSGEKKLTHLFSSEKSYVKVKANISNSVLRCGEKIQLQFEVMNDTNIVIKGVKVKVIEVYTFKYGNGEEIFMEEKVSDASVYSKDSGTLVATAETASIESGETQEMSLVIYVPESRESLDFSNIVSREYFIVMSVKLPMPHRNYELKIPVQIGHTLDEQGVACSNHNTWLLMYRDSDSVLQE